MAFDPLKTLPTRQVVSFFDEFRNFAFKGNMIDLAIAVVIGGAFGKVVDSLVKNIVMQIVTAVVGLFGKGAESYEKLSVPLFGVPINYGAFLADLLNFVIVAFSVFLLMVKVIGWLGALRKRAAGEAAAVAATAPEPPPTKDQLLLAEIRDLLKSRQAT
ncbi:MAG TPA: large conductance mechanosensitive channel protein MscL [Gemmataceae bacterium]|jgi:large conductance mechanosensitive channel|nr:large conductance mechanosensitive channel protein MscL [Gemmataceae bacterium]